MAQRGEDPLAMAASSDELPEDSELYKSDAFRMQCMKVRVRAVRG